MLPEVRDSVEAWHQRLLEQLDSLFGGRGDRLYGPEHALAVEETVLGNLRKAESRFEGADLLVLRSAALLHDVGFARRTDSWSVDRFEHVKYSIEISEAILREMPLFFNPELISRVLELIGRHDDSTYAFPSPDREGLVVAIPRVAETELLAWLREADALVHVDDESVSRAVSEWQNAGLPLADPVEFGGTASEWGHSVTGNLRLTTKRAVVDAFSEDAKLQSLAAYERAERQLQERSRHAGAAYEPELCPPAARDQSLARLAGRRREVQLLSSSGWQELLSVLRSVEIKADRAIRPYSNARVESRVISSDEISPLSLYVTEDKIARAVELHDLLMAGYCLSIFDLLGLLNFRLDGGEAWVIAPPVVETFVEHGAERGEQVSGLVDGLHRWFGAGRVGLDRVRAIVVHGVTVPLISFPAKWVDVKIYPADQSPAPDEKRHYRYASRSDFPDGQHGVTTPVTEENFQYFFYRDLKALGSAGVRKFQSR